MLRPRAFAMPENSPDNTIAEIERQLLRALCSGVSAADDWNQLARRLSVYRWREPDHKVVYQALRTIKSNAPRTRREELPAQVTRMGFPDLDCGAYFEGKKLSAAEIEELLRRLTATASEQS
jgi:hypothetical protein